MDFDIPLDDDFQDYESSSDGEFTPPEPLRPWAFAELTGDELEDEEMDDEDIILQNSSKAVLIQEPSTIMQLSSLLSNIHSGEDEEEIDLTLDKEDLLFDADFLNPKKKKKGRKKDYGMGRSTTVNLPPHIASLMGRANSHYVKREFDEACLLLHDVIRQAPNSHEAYLTLGLINEEKGDIRTAAGFLLIAAHIVVKDASLWKRLAAMSLQLKMMRQTVYCLSRAARVDPNDQEALWQLGFLCVRLGLKQRAVSAFALMCKRRPGDLQVLKEASKLYVELNEPNKATALFLDAMSHSTGDETTTLSHINIYGELCLLAKEYSQGADWIPFYTLRYLRNKTGDRVTNEELLLRQSMPVPLKAKATMCVIMSATPNNFLTWIDMLSETAPHEEYPEIYLELGDALFERGFMNNALDMWKPLLDVESISSLYLWMRLGRCYQHEQMFPLAMDMYKKVLDSDPSNDEARLGLAQIHEALGQNKEASEWIEQIGIPDRVTEAPKKPKRRKRQKDFSFIEGGATVLSFDSDHNETFEYDIPRCKQFRILLRKANLAFEQGLFQEFLSTALVFLDDFCSNPMIFPDRLRPFVARGPQPVLDKQDELFLKNELGEDIRSAALLHGLTVKEWQNLILRAVDVNVQLRDYCAAFKWITRTMKSSIIFFERKSEWLCLMLGKYISTSSYSVLSVHSRNETILSDVARTVIYDLKESAISFNLYSELLSEHPNAYIDQKNIKYFIRLEREAPCAYYNSVLGNMNLMTKSYFSALGYFLMAIKTTNHNPCLFLSAGICYLLLFNRRTSCQKLGTLVKAFTFLFKYHYLAGETQESFYNLARAFHHIELYSAALEYYTLALEKPETDLRNKIYYHMQLIYARSGNFEKARELLMKAEW